MEYFTSDKFGLGPWDPTRDLFYPISWNFYAIFHRDAWWYGDTVDIWSRSVLNYQFPHVEGTSILIYGDPPPHENIPVGSDQVQDWLPVLLWLVP